MSITIAFTNEQLYGIYDQWNQSYQLSLSHQGLSKELVQRGFGRWRNMHGRGIYGMKPKQIGIDTGNIPDIDNTK